MAARSGDRRFFATTRGRIVTLLRGTTRTVDDLARELDLTHNAIRAHLVALERDGLVRQHGQRRGDGKPAFTYRLTAEAESLFPKAYTQILREVLAQLAERHGRSEIESVLRAVGRELATTMAARATQRTMASRLAVANDVWRDLGGLSQVRRDDDHFVLEELSCPFREIVTAYPEACKLALALLQSVVDTPVEYEHCVRDAEPYCRFQIAAVE